MISVMRFAFFFSKEVHPTRNLFSCWWRVVHPTRNPFTCGRRVVHPTRNPFSRGRRVFYPTRNPFTCGWRVFYPTRILFSCWWPYTLRIFKKTFNIFRKKYFRMKNPSANYICGWIFYFQLSICTAHPLRLRLPPDMQGAHN